MVKINKLPKNVKHLYLDVIGDEKVNVFESRNHVYIYYVLDCGVFRVTKSELKDLSVKVSKAYEELRNTNCKE